VVQPFVYGAALVTEGSEQHAAVQQLTGLAGSAEPPGTSEAGPLLPIGPGLRCFAACPKAAVGARRSEIPAGNAAVRTM
jgi:hypothetical protein